MWLTCSSIGRKFVMAITGACLVLFVTFHVLMNSVALLWPAAYNVICEFLGANWYALVASAGLALLFIIHIIYALWLTVQNRRARGNDRYAIAGAAPGVEWSSKNMLVLGIVVVAFLIVHLIQFWAKMQLQELVSHELTALPVVGEAPAAPHFGTLFLQAAFENWWTPVIYIVGFIALWFHMNHGFWSMFHTIGWDNNTWLPRLKSIACWWTSVVVLLFIAQAVLFTVQANNKFFLTDQALQEQYAEFWAEKGEALIEEFQQEVTAATTGDNVISQQQAQIDFFAERGEYFGKTAEAISNAAAAQAPAVKLPALQQLGQFATVINRETERAAQLKKTNESANNNQ
ncbi:MAG: succinate dehydrogenase cytochrome b subunit [Muribaculaceae bacterium]|nr:succinate dehydrogenase cytochrome b subunit [Muribaculaceae bacterium]MDE6196550.1 succinate dehydrogenase cytochrome b subunit [Muribaculaceae bacterium]